jgi:hypothetical protein
MAGERFEFECELFRWDARRDHWVLVRVPADVSAEIEDRPHPPSGFGAVKVTAMLGSSRWSTSVFPEHHDGVTTYVLPVGAKIRRRERVEAGDTVRLAVETML